MASSGRITVDLGEHFERVSREMTRAARAFASAVAVLPNSQLPSPEQLDERVNAGVAFLDQRLGRDFWLARIDVNTLNVVSQMNCVVCQVTGSSYAVGVELLGGPTLTDDYERLAWAAQRGFALPFVTLTGYAKLTAAWIAKVRELRAASVADESVRITA